MKTLLGKRSRSRSLAASRQGRKHRRGSVDPLTLGYEGDASSDSDSESPVIMNSPRPSLSGLEQPIQANLQHISSSQRTLVDAGEVDPQPRRLKRLKARSTTRGRKGTKDDPTLPRAKSTPSIPREFVHHPPHPLLPKFMDPNLPGLTPFWREVIERDVVDTRTVIPSSEPEVDYPRSRSDSPVSADDPLFAASSNRGQVDSDSDQDFSNFFLNDISRPREPDHSLRQVARQSFPGPLEDEEEEVLWAHYPEIGGTQEAIAINEEIYYLLTNVFGLQRLHHQQYDVIRRALRGEDILVLWPTGSGKSLCYQLPALCKSGHSQGITFVISPLKSLIKNQVDDLADLNVDVVDLSGDHGNDYLWRINPHRTTKLPRIVYLTPEKLECSDNLTDLMKDLYWDQLIARFVIDEVHCVDTHGDFRPSYPKLSTLRRDFPVIPITALTATATSAVLSQIRIQLACEDSYESRRSLDRPNLKILVQEKSNKSEAAQAALLGFISENHPEDSGIIYCWTRTHCDNLVSFLRSEKFSAQSYHSGIGNTQREKVQKAWLAGSTKIVVATTAFGMGIDKPNVRFVIHWDVPKSLSSYVQEIGRAGRDGRSASCLLYFSFADAWLQMGQVACPALNSNQTDAKIKENIEQLRVVMEYATNTLRCRRTVFTDPFSENSGSIPEVTVRCNPPSQICDNCCANVSGEDSPSKAMDWSLEAGLVISRLSEVLQTLSEAEESLEGVGLSEFGNWIFQAQAPGEKPGDPPIIFKKPLGRLNAKPRATLFCQHLVAHGLIGYTAILRSNMKHPCVRLILDRDPAEIQVPQPLLLSFSNSPRTSNPRKKNPRDGKSVM